MLSEGRKGIKYDKSDASILSHLAGADLISKCYVPEEEYTRNKGANKTEDKIFLLEEHN